MKNILVDFQAHLKYNSTLLTKLRETLRIDISTLKTLIIMVTQAKTTFKLAISFSATKKSKCFVHVFLLKPLQTTFAYIVSVLYNKINISAFITPLRTSHLDGSFLPIVRISLTIEILHGLRRKKKEEEKIWVGLKSSVGI